MSVSEISKDTCLGLQRKYNLWHKNGDISGSAVSIFYQLFSNC